jgi:hypothetical protein
MELAFDVPGRGLAQDLGDPEARRLPQGKWDAVIQPAMAVAQARSAPRLGCVGASSVGSRGGSAHAAARLPGSAAIWLLGTWARPGSGSSHRPDGSLDASSKLGQALIPTVPPRSSCCYRPVARSGLREQVWAAPLAP